MRSIFFIIACCLALADLRAQKITQEYNNVSLSEALRQLNEQTDDYTISFLYNELEESVSPHPSIVSLFPMPSAK